MHVQVNLWGNGALVRIPASVMAAAALRIGQEVDVREDEGRIVIEPVLAPSYDLDTLLAGMTPDTFPDEVDFGRPPQHHEPDNLQSILQDEAGRLSVLAPS